MGDEWWWRALREGSALAGEGGKVHEEGTVGDKGVAVPATVSEGLLYGDQGTARTHPMTVVTSSASLLLVFCVSFLFLVPFPCHCNKKNLCPQAQVC